PSHVESVAWITGRKDVLSGVLVLAAWLVALTPTRDGRTLARAFALFLAALASKTLAWVLAPFLVLESRLAGRLDGREAARLAPFVVLAVAWVLIELWAQKSLGAVRPLRRSMPGQLRLAAWSVAWYPLRFVAPWPLTPRPRFELPAAASFGDAWAVA